jgi:hypothetical protein
VIRNGHKQPIIDRALISIGLYELVIDRFNLCKGLYLTSVTKDSCNGRLRRLFQKSTLVTDVVEANHGVGLPHLPVTAAK